MLLLTMLSFLQLSDFFIIVKAILYFAQDMKKNKILVHLLIHYGLYAACSIERKKPKHFGMDLNHGAESQVFTLLM